MPIEWEELKKAIDPEAFNVTTAAARIAAVADPWAGMGDVRQRLPA